MESIVTDPKATKLERIEAARVIAACFGLVVPSAMESREVPTKLQIQVQAARRTVLEKLGLKKAAEARRNRRKYLKRKIAALEAAQQETNEQQLR